MLTNSKCTICGSDNVSYFQYGNHSNKFNLKFVKHLLLFIVLPIIQYFKPDSRLYYISIFSPLAKIKRCNNCGYGCYQKLIPDYILRNYYKQIYHEQKHYVDIDNYESPRIIDKRANQQYRFVSNYLSKKLQKIRMLEIGAGSAMTSRKISKIFSSRVTVDVIEPGSIWKTYYKKQNFNFVADFFPFKTEKKYNYIHTSHWLEHVGDLNEVMQSLSEITGENGLIFIEVPNCNEEYFNSDFGDEPHIHFFTKKSLVRLFKTRGFKVLKIGTYGKSIKQINLCLKNNKNYGSIEKEKQFIRGLFIKKRLDE